MRAIDGCDMSRYYASDVSCAKDDANCKTPPVAKVELLLKDFDAIVTTTAHIGARLSAIADKVVGCVPDDGAALKDYPKPDSIEHKLGELRDYMQSNLNYAEHQIERLEGFFGGPK